MPLPPGWKIKRELYAAWDQLKALGLMLLAPLMRLGYDNRELKDIKIFEGERFLGRNLILYLIYQPDGLLDSNYSAIQSFLAQDSDILIVSNGELSDSDLKRLRPLTWRVIVRKNLGYDFGGYRCGLNYLRSHNFDFYSINLINDSIWYPIVPDPDILSRLQSEVSDFGGPVCLADSKFKDAKLVLSYWLTIKNGLFHSESFWRYWQQYIPTRNKTLTVKLGERGLSRQMNKDGRIISGLFTLDKFLGAMELATVDQLTLTLRYASFTDPSFERECKELLISAQKNEIWRSSCLEFIRRVSMKRNFLHSFCYPAIAILGVPFLKKNNLKLQIEMRKKYLAAVRNGDLPMPEPLIFKEIADSVTLANQAMAFR